MRPSSVLIGRIFPAAQTKIPLKITHRHQSGLATNIEMNPDSLVEEVKIPVPWGHVSGKWWGPKHVRPLLGLHGWQDNAGTYDRLAPLLPKHISLLAIDLPGHGLSSNIPDGMAYNATDSLHLIKYIKREYNWNKISLIGHSMGSVIGFMYSGIFPDDVDMMIGIDALKPHIYPAELFVEHINKRIDKFIEADIRNQIKSEPPSYPYDELVNRLHDGTFQSVTKEACHFLLKRAIQKSEKFPDQYFFTRDSRVKHNNGSNLSQSMSVAIAKRQKMPYLFIKATNSPYYEDVKYFDEIAETMKKSNPKFELHRVEGTHHLHLTHPEDVSGIICDFINKNKPAKEVASKL